MGNFPVWSEYIDFLVASNVRKYTSLCLTPGVGLNSCIVSSSITFVDLTPCFTCFMWPFCVSSDSGKCLVTLDTVSAGNVTRLPLRIAVSNVAFVGNPSAACKNLTTSFVDGNSYTFIATSASLGAGLHIGASTIGTVQSPPASLHPWSKAGLFKVSSKSSMSCTVTPRSCG